MRNSAIGLMIFALLGCASLGTGDGGETVPVYRATYDVPCMYEVMDTVSAQRTYSSSYTGDDAEAGAGALEPALGRAGARAGADAVIVVGQPSATVRVPGPGQPPQWVEGEAVRYIDPTCGPASAPPVASAPVRCENLSQIGLSADMSLGEVDQAQALLGMLGSWGADLLLSNGDQILLQNPDELIERTRLEYPPLFREEGIPGTVRVLLLVAESGKVQLVHISDSSGHRALDDAALTIARHAEFNQQRSGDTPLCHWVSFSIEFGRGEA